MLTLNKLKQFLNIPESKTEKDEILLTCISNAVDEANNITNRILNFAGHIEIKDGYANDIMYLENYPVEKIEELQELVNGGWTDILSIIDDTTLFINSDEGYIRLLGGVVFTEGKQNIRVKYNAGFVSGDDWIPQHIYNADDYAVYNGKLFKCKTSHTSGEEFEIIYWELATEIQCPKALEKAITYLAADQYLKSLAGESRFNISAETISGSSSEARSYKDIDISKILNSYRNINI
jgi:hypothetical protein